MNKKNILFYGTCQSKGIKDVLNLSDNDFIQYHIQCYSTNITKDELNNILHVCDIIITQPVPDNYRDVDYLSTTYIINTCKKDCKVLIYQRQYFNFYYYDTLYYKINNEDLHKPNDYHYQEMINYYKNNKSCSDYINNIVNNKNLKSKEELDYIANESIQYLFDRDRDIRDQYLKGNTGNIIYISIVQYIKDNYKKKLLFYSMNHPTNILLQYIAEKIIDKLNFNNSINYNADPLNEPKCILYKCIQNSVDFDISNEKVGLCDKNDIDSIVNLYYDTYKLVVI
jgi:hypothetical protein